MSRTAPARALAREERLAESARKIRPPFVLDPTLRFYSPQENRDALDHPRVAPWLRFVASEWTPEPVDGSTDRIALLLPCTKYKPYPTSREHRGINAALLAAGWAPAGEGERQRAGGWGSAGEGERQRAGGRGSEGEGERQRAGGWGSEGEGERQRAGGRGSEGEGERQRAGGWGSEGEGDAPEALRAMLDPGEDPAVLHAGPLQRGATVLDRFVISEPLALVPYEHVYYWRGEQSPATSYDDPGLFESRGTSVSPERDDCTAQQRADGTWRWGPAERDAYADVHERIVAVLSAALSRLRPNYTAMVAWVSPGLTHRSFLADRALRRAEGIAAARRGTAGIRRLSGVLDAHPGLIDVLPARAHLAQASVALAVRLRREGRPATAGSVRSVLARGDGHDTPLGLPEALVHLTAWLDAHSPATQREVVDGGR